MKRYVIFWIEMGFLIVLLGLGLLFFVRRDWLGFVPISFGPIPVGVPWYGALGAVLLSLTAVFEHEQDWDVSYWPWHVGRPFVGASLGIVSVLILKAGILAVGSSPGNAANPGAAAGGVASAIPPNLLYYLIAFLVGYREETFRELIKRLTDVLLTPGSGTKGDPPVIKSITPSTAPSGTATASIVIRGSGFTGTRSVMFGDLPAKDIHVDSDTQLTLTGPVVDTSGPVIVTVSAKSGSATSSFIFTQPA